VVSLAMPPSAAILLGWDIGVTIYLAWTWGAVRGLDPTVTAQRAKREDPSTPVADLVIIGASAAILLGLFLGGGRALYRMARGKPISSVYDTEFIRLDLRD